MNIYKFSTALLATIIATACSEMITPEVPEGAGQITVTAKVGVDVKAGYDSKTLPGTFFMSINQGSDESFNYDLTMTKAEDNIYRANRDQLRWASSNHGNVLVNAITLPSVSGESVQINLTGEQNTEDKLNANDILGAKSGSGVTISGDNIDISFKHLMSKLHVVYESDDDIKVKSIELKNVSMGGEFNFVTMSPSRFNPPSAAAIKMYLDDGIQYGTKVAEAIFYPYDSKESGRPSLIVTAEVAGQDKLFNAVAFADNGKIFEGGKRYMLKLQITEEKVTVSSLSENAWVKNVPGGKILWIGTSIPSTGFDGLAWDAKNCYPHMIANATGLTIVNNARPSSYVSFDSNCNWTTSAEAVEQQTFGWSLSATIDEVDKKYRTALTNICEQEKLDMALVDQWITDFQGYSYENLIIPYINGEKDDCQVVVIDHGYNDASAIVHECWCNAFRLDYETYGNPPTQTPNMDERPTGYSWIKSIANGSQTYFDMGDGAFFEKRSYINAMRFIFDECYKINPNIKIIIGNYFAETTPLFETHFKNNQVDRGGAKCCKLMNLANEAIAKMNNLEVVNVYKYTNINEETDPNWSKFHAYCPDDVHPGMDPKGELNSIISKAYIQELATIFNNTGTKSTGGQSYTVADYSWEDVELFK